MKNIVFYTVLILLGAAAPGFTLGTASDTLLTAGSSISIYNYTAPTVASGASQTVRGVFGFATSTVSEEAAKTAVAGATATYDVTFQYTGNATDTMTLAMGAQTFGGAVGDATNWAVAAERVGVGFLTFTTSGGPAAAQAGDSAAIASVSPDASTTMRLHHHVAADATAASYSTFTLALSSTNYPGAPYYGYNGTLYGGATSWSRQLDSGYVITTVNGMQIDATKTFTITAPAAYVTSGGGASAVVPGSSLNYTLTFSNSGGQAANTVVILDTLPANTTFTAGSILSCFTGSACTPVADPDANGADPDCYAIGAPVTQIQCDIPALAAGSGGIITYKAAID